MGKLTRFQPGSIIKGSDLNLILDYLDGGAFTVQNTTAVSGNNSGSTGDTGGGSNNGGSGLPTPTTPTGFGGSSGLDLLAQVNNGYAYLSWAPNPAGDFVTEYDIEYRKAGDSTTLMWHVGGGSSSTKIPNLFPGFTYVFNIRAVNGINRYSAWSSDLSLAIQADTVPPAVPTNLQAFSVTKGVWLQWTPSDTSVSADLQNYVIDWSADNFVTNNVIQSDNSSSYFFSYTNLNPADSQAALKFKVAARDWSGNTSAYCAPVSGTVGGLAFDELTVGTLRAIGTIGAAGGFTTRVGGTGVGVDIKSTGIALYNSGNAQTIFLDSSTGNVTITGNAAISGAANAATIVAGTIMSPDANVFTTGGAVMDGSGFQVRAKGSSNYPAGATTWFANVNGQFLTSQYFPAFSGYMPVDGVTPATFRFQVVGDIVRIIKATFSIFVDSYKFGKQVTSSGGSAHNHTLNATSTATDDSHYHLIPFDQGGGTDTVQVTDAGTTISYNGQTYHEAFQATTHASPIVIYTGKQPDPNATHSHNIAAQTSNTEAAHTHNLNDPSTLVNISSITQITTVKIFDPSNTLKVTLGPYAVGVGSAVLDVDITSYLRNADWSPAATGFWRVEIQPNALGAVQGQVNVKATVQAI